MQPTEPVDDESMDGVVKTGIGGKTNGFVGNGSEMGAIGDIGDV